MQPFFTSLFARSGLSVLFLITALCGGLAARGEQGDPGARLIVLNKSEASAIVYALPQGEKLATLKVGEGPHEVALSPDHRFAVVANYGKMMAGRSLSVIDLEKLQVVHTLDLGQEIQPHGMVFEPDGKALWVTAEKEQEVWKVAFPSGQVLQKVKTGQAASHMVVLGSDGMAYVSNILSHSVTPVNTRTGQAGTPLATGMGAEGLALTVDGKHLWVANRGEDSIVVIDTATHEVVRRMSCKGYPVRVYPTADGSRMIVSCAYGPDLKVFDARDGRELGSVLMEMKAIETGEGRLPGADFGDRPIPMGAAVDAEGRFAYVANAGADLVAVVDLAGMKVVGAFETGKEPDGIAYIPPKLAPIKSRDKE